MKIWLTDKELAETFGITRQGINLKAKRGKWKRRAFTVNGGTEYRYHLTDLPEDVQVAYAASLNLTLEALQAELKPVPKAEVKVAIDGYKCRGGTKTYKTLKECTKAELEIARDRQRIIAAYEQAHSSGVNAKQFVSFYNRGQILPEVKAALGDWGDLKDWRRFMIHG